MIVTQVEEVQSELGGTDCKLTEPFVYDQENETLSPWLLNLTTQNTFMLSSDKILTLVNPNSKIVKKYESVIEEWGFIPMFKWLVTTSWFVKL